MPSTRETAGPGRRRRREREERRQQILDAARLLLSRKGLKAVSVNQIARQAELGVGTLYFYFRSKEDIFASLQDEGLRLLHGVIAAAAAAADDPRDQLRGMARAYLEFSRRQANYFEIINYFLSSPDVLFSASVKRQIDSHGRQILQQVAEAIERGAAAGLFRALPTYRTAIVFWGLLHGLLPFRKMRDTLLRGEDHQVLLEYAVEQFLDSLRVTRPSD
jgi:AcrR family transcriptional regulator